MNTIFTPSVSAQDEPALIIEIYDSNDWNESAGTLLFEKRNYDITVSTEDESIILGVNITLLGKTYLTSLTEPFITVESPRFDESDSFIITATKQGYLPDSVEVTVLKGELSIITDRGTVEEKKEFQVTVRDQNDAPVEGAFVYITDDATPILTDLQGIAYVLAPDVETITTETIQVIKSGYLPGSTIIRVENVEGSIFDLTESRFLQILPILIAILVVIFAIVYVFLRQKRTSKIPDPAKGVEKRVDSRTYHQDKQKPRFKNEPMIYPETEKKDLSASSLEPRVEEIRIPTQAKKKETTYLSDEKEPEQNSDEQKKQQDEWFKGQDYMRYKLDELTGKIDQKTDGKWFEGEHGSKYKVDETLKKNVKKKKTDANDNK